MTEREGIAHSELLRRFYDRIAPRFASQLESATDLQSDFAERLEVVETLAGRKPSFFAFAGDPARHRLFENIRTDLVEFGTSLGLECGIDKGRFHKAHRQLNIVIPELSQLIASRQEIQPLFWATYRPALAAAYRAGTAAEVGEPDLLGYPACCTAWHYDTYYARQIEAIVAVYRHHASPAQMRDYFSKWTPSPGEFFPKQVAGAAVFRSNAKYPYITYVACPQCLHDVSSLSAEKNAAASRIGKVLDPDLHDRVGVETTTWGARVPQMIADWRKDLEGEARGLQLGVAARDTYLRLGRHWFNAFRF